MKKKVNLMRGEKLLYFLIVCLSVGYILGRSFSMALLSKTNIEVERIKSKINKQENVNESLTMKINELASLDNVEEVASIFGLEYNNNNIKIISE